VGAMGQAPSAHLRSLALRWRAAPWQVRTAGCLGPHARLAASRTWSQGSAGSIPRAGRTGGWVFDWPGWRAEGHWCLGSQNAREWMSRFPGPGPTPGQAAGQFPAQTMGNVPRRKRVLHEGPLPGRHSGSKRWGVSRAREGAGLPVPRVLHAHDPSSTSTSPHRNLRCFNLRRLRPERTRPLPLPSP